MAELMADPMLAGVSPIALRWNWQERGSCRSSSLPPDTWFPVQPEAGISDDAVIARLICGHCPVRFACQREAMRDPKLVGIWGGTDEAERDRIRRKERRRRA